MNTFPSENHKFSIGNYEFYLVVYFEKEEGVPSGINLVSAKSGSTLRGMFALFSTAINCAITQGMPWQDVAGKFIGTTFEPNGYTSNPDIPTCKSVADYVCQYLLLRFK